MKFSSLSNAVSSREKEIRNLQERVRITSEEKEKSDVQIINL